MPEAGAARSVEITLKLFASLADHLPQEFEGRTRRYNELAVRVDDGATVQAVIDRFHVPSAMAHLVLVNGVYVPREERGDRTLRDGDSLAVWPPIAGG